MSEHKAALRRQLRVEAAGFTEADRAHASRQICEHVRQSPRWASARSILLFAPLRDEPDISPLMREAWARGCAVALPRHVAEEDAYVPCVVRDAAADWAVGRYGVREPSATCPVFPGNHLDLVLVPGVGFSLVGVRLGRGKGYYDRLLPRLGGCKCGVAFAWQLVRDLPQEVHDIRLDCLVTPAGWHDVAGQPGS